MPSRAVSNFNSAHDVERNRAIDKFYTRTDGTSKDVSNSMTADMASSTAPSARPQITRRALQPQTAQSITRARDFALRHDTGLELPRLE